jgi:Protein of unknown function (DUF3341)
MAKNKAAFGIYRTQSGLENAVQMLRDERFSNSDVAVLLPESVSSRELGTQKASKAPEGATAGAGSGAVLGGILGWLVGIGSLAIPGVGPFIAAGPIVAALAGAGVGGAVGGLAGALVGMGIPEYEAKRYEGRLTEGGILLSIHCDSSEEIDRAKKIMERTGAEDISHTSESSVKEGDRSRGASPGRY